METGFSFFRRYMRYTEKKMKKTFCFIFSLFAAFVFCSCASFEPTRNLEEALANVEDGIVYYDREYMESKDLTPPNVPDLEKLGVLKFLFAFDQHQSAGNAEVDTKQHITYINTPAAAGTATARSFEESPTTVYAPYAAAPITAEAITVFTK